MKTLILLLALSFASSLHAQTSWFIIVDSGSSYPIESSLLATADGGFLVSIEAKTPPGNEEGLTGLLKVRRDGTVEQGLSCGPVMRQIVGPSELLLDSRGNIYRCGISVDSNSAVTSMISRFSPDLTLFRSTTFSPETSVIGTGAITPDDHLIVEGTAVYRGDDFTPFVASLTPSGDLRWIKRLSIKPFHLNVWDIDLATRTGTILMTGRASFEGCCPDQPTGLISISDDGALSSAELLYYAEEGTGTEAYTTFEVEGILSDDSRTIIYGNLLQRTPTEENDPDSMPMFFKTEQSGLVFCLDRDRNFLWGRKIGIESEGWKAAMMNDSTIILATLDSSAATFLHLDAEGNTLGSYKLADSLRAMLNGKRNVQSPAVGTSATHFIISSLATTSTDQIAALFNLYSPTSARPDDPLHSVGLLLFDPRFPSPCTLSEIPDVRIEPAGIRRESFEIELLDMEPVNVRSVQTESETFTPSIRNLCPAPPVIEDPDRIPEHR